MCQSLKNQQSKLYIEDLEGQNMKFFGDIEGLSMWEMRTSFYKKEVDLQVIKLIFIYPLKP